MVSESISSLSALAKLVQSQESMVVSDQIQAWTKEAVVHILTVSIVVYLIVMPYCLGTHCAGCR